MLTTDWNWPLAVPSAGSAIFIHTWRRPGAPTAGCLALSRADLLWLVVIGVLNSVVSGFYYLSVARQMFLGEAEDEKTISTSPSIAVALGAATLGVLVFGLIPTPLISAAESAVDALRTVS